MQLLLVDHLIKISMRSADYKCYRTLLAEVNQNDINIRVVA